MRGVVVGVLVAMGAAHAEPMLRLETRGVCDLAALPSRVAALAGREPFSEAAATLISVATSPVGRGYAARIARDDLDASRVVIADTCDALVDAVALVIAMALPTDPLPAEPAVAAPPALQARDIDPAMEVRAAPAPPSDRPERFAIYGEVAARSAGGGAVIAGVRWRSRMVEARVDGADTRAITAGSSVSIRTLAITVARCGRVGGLEACATATVGAIRGTSEHLADAHDATSPLVAGGARIVWEHVLAGAVALRLHADLDVRLTSSHFDVDRMPVWTSSRFEGLAAAGLIVRFP